jgi:hypothetical protein
MEVIWGNRLQPGDYKYIGGFPHFVADAGEDRVGRWLDEKIDLARVYAEIWKDVARLQPELAPKLAPDALAQHGVIRDEGSLPRAERGRNPYLWYNLG